MKIYLCIVGLFCALVLVKSDPPAEVKKVFEECEKELGVVTESILKPEHADDPKAKCFHACILKKNGSMVGGKIVAEKAIEVGAKFKPSGVGDPVEAAVFECANKANVQTDECEVAGAFFKCTMKNHHH